MTFSHTNAPVEVSVWQVGIPRLSGFVDVCDKVAWKLVGGLQGLPAAAWDSQVEVRQGVEGLLALVGMLLPLYKHQGVSHAAEGGI